MPVRRRQHQIGPWRHHPLRVAKEIKAERHEDHPKPGEPGRHDQADHGHNRTAGYERPAGTVGG